MGMPVSIHIVDTFAKKKDILAIFQYLHHIDDIFSTYKKTSEISKINSGFLDKQKASEEVQRILTLCFQTEQETNGYFNPYFQNKLDPSGIVKGYAISQGANMLRNNGYRNFSIEIAGDVEVSGLNGKNEKWKIGIQNPFAMDEIIKIISVSNKGIATSGNYVQGQHIYNPITKKMTDEIASITVIGESTYEADRFATAAFAMGEKGIQFIESLVGFEAYMITKNKQAIYTSGFEKFVIYV